MAKKTKEQIEAETKEAQNRARIAELERQRLEREEHLTLLQAEEEARNEDKERERQKEQQQNPAGEATGRGGSLINVTNILKPTSRGGYFFWVIIVLIILLILWYFNIWRASFYYVGLIMWIGFIFWGFYLGATSDKDKATPIFIAAVLLVWLLDMNPLIGSFLGQPYGGFDISLSEFATALALTLPLFLTSGLTFAFLYVNMVFKIIKKEYIAFLLVFFFILFSNILMAKFFPRFYSISIPIPYGNIGFLVMVVGGFMLAGYLNGKNFGAKIIREIPGFFTYLFMIFVFCFFWFNSGWMSTPRAWLHVIYIIFFGFLYIMPREKDNPSLWHILIPVSLIVDFFGYGLLINTFEYEWVKFIPTLVIFVIAYCYDKTENAYALTSFIVLITVILALSIQAYGYESGSGLPFKQRTGADLKDFLGTLGDKLRGSIEGQLNIATAGLYRGSVENNRYESLGVYFSKIRAADPRFYTDEPITVWGSIRSKTYKDAVIVNFSCYRFKDNKRIRADRLVPDIKFPIFTLEEVDAECTFLPKAKNENPVSSGANTITFSAEYNFGTDAYLKTYFMDRERFRANARENIDQLAQFGIKDKKPSSVSTNGPVEIGIGAGPLVPVSEGYAVKPAIGITLTNRQEIKDKDKNIITKWDGRIKNITELVLLVPPGIEIKGAGDLSLDVACNKENFEQGKCPCSMPFYEYKMDNCLRSCVVDIQEPCVKVCMESGAKSEMQGCVDECSSAALRCNDECGRLFQSEDSPNSKYKAYALDVGSLKFKDLNKDIDKHRSFVCRYEPSSSLLDNTPITTRYFRVRARYNYVVENSVSVNVEQLPVEAINVVPENLFKISVNIQKDSPLWFEGYSPQLIDAIASVESRFRHCCNEKQSTNGVKTGATCTSSADKECLFDNLITSGTSFGIMQINYKGKNKELVDSLASQYCGKDANGNNININNYDCNVKVGIAILKAKYDAFRNGCKETSEYKSQNKVKYKTFIDGCENGVSKSGVRYDSYTGYKAAVRGYNGWGRDSRFDVDYVEKVLNAMQKMSGAQIIDSTLANINRVGSGMANEEDSGASGVGILKDIIEAVDSSHNYDWTYNDERTLAAAVDLSDDPTKRIVTIRWHTSSNPGYSKYVVKRFLSTLSTTPLYTTVCQIDENGLQKYQCIDNSASPGTSYIYQLDVISSENKYFTFKIALKTTP